MKKLIILTILFLTSSFSVLAQEITDNNINDTQEYYRKQIIVLQNYSKTNFMKSIVEGDTYVINAYAKSGMDVNAKQMKLSTVMLAIGSNKPKSLETLIQNGANIEAETMGISPLIFAINQGHIDCIKILIDNKVDINKTYKGITPLYVAIMKKKYTIAQLLLDAGAIVDDDSIIKAVKSQNTEIKNSVLKTAVKQLD